MTLGSSRVRSHFDPVPAVLVEDPQEGGVHRHLDELLRREELLGLDLVVLVLGPVPGLEHVLEEELQSFGALLSSDARLLQPLLKLVTFGVLLEHQKLVRVELVAVEVEHPLVGFVGLEQASVPEDPPAADDHPVQGAHYGQGDPVFGEDVETDAEVLGQDVPDIELDTGVREPVCPVSDGGG
jgi:hypothetical protein